MWVTLSDPFMASCREEKTPELQPPGVQATLSLLSSLFGSESYLHGLGLPSTQSLSLGT